MKESAGNSWTTWSIKSRPCPSPALKFAGKFHNNNNKNVLVFFIIKMMIDSISVLITRSVSACWQLQKETAEGRRVGMQSNLLETCLQNHWPFSPNNAKMCQSTCHITFKQKVEWRESDKATFHHYSYRRNSANCQVGTLGGTTVQEMWETSVPVGPLQDSTRSTFNDFTTRRSNNFVWQQTTYKPWYPGIRSNPIDAPKQQGLFSNARKPIGSPLLFLTVLSIVLWF